MHSNPKLKLNVNWTNISYLHLPALQLLAQSIQVSVQVEEVFDEGWLHYGG